VSPSSSSCPLDLFLTLCAKWFLLGECFPLVALMKIARRYCAIRTNRSSSRSSWENDTAVKAFAG
jgi:hypothetical protein